MTISAPYAQFVIGLGNGGFAMTTDTFKVMLASSTYTPLMASHQYASAVGTSEITGTGYTAGGKELTGLSWIYDPVNLWIAFKAANPTWTGATFTARYAIVYKATGDPATSPLVSYVDFLTNQSVASDTFTLDFSAGIVHLTPSSVSG